MIKIVVSKAQSRMLESMQRRGELPCTWLQALLAHCSVSGEIPSFYPYSKWHVQAAMTILPASWWLVQVYDGG